MKILKGSLRFSFLVVISLLIVLSFTPIISAAEFIKTTNDPTRTGVGARPLGMGKAFVGVLDDASSIFLNPAGIATIKNWQVTSMSTRLLDEIDYLIFGGVYPTEDYGNFGFGYVGAGMSDSFITGLDIVEGGGQKFTIVSTEEPISYRNSVIILTYGSKARRFLDFDFLEDLSVGVSYKMFSQELTGVQDGGSLSGMDMDFGMIHETNEWLTLGMNLVDILPADSGGKLVSENDVEHNIPAIMKIGGVVKVMGPEGLYESEQNLYYLLDFDSKIQKSDYPTLMHTGFEYWPNEMLALRLGIDQDIINKGGDIGDIGEIGTTSNFCSGVGFIYEGFRFDYAFHQYGELPANDTHFISMSYGFLEPEVVVEVPKTYFEIISPADKSILYDESIKIKGLVTNPEYVEKLTINDVEIDVTLEGSFEVATKLNLGKNLFLVKAYDKDNNMLKNEKIRILKLIKFKDVRDDYWSRKPIEFLAVLGIIGGYPDGTFRPNNKITRAEVTTLLVRAKEFKLPEATEEIFKDLKKVHWAAKYVQVGVREKLVTGYPDKTFKPKNSITRAEGVTLLTRFAELEQPETLLEGPYSDVPGRHWAAKFIAASKSAGMLVYLGEKPFMPNQALTRAETVEILSKTPFAAAKINDLIDFETY